MPPHEIQMGMTVYFNDGSRLRFTGPRQAKNTWDAIRKLQSFLDRPYIVFETEDGVVVVPTTNIKYFQFSPKPEGLPEFVLKGTRVVEE